MEILLKLSGDAGKVSPEWRMLAQVLVHVLEVADQTPSRFAAFILDRVKAAALGSVQRDGRLDREQVEGM